MISDKLFVTFCASGPSKQIKFFYCWLLTANNAELKNIKSLGSKTIKWNIIFFIFELFVQLFENNWFINFLFDNLRKQWNKQKNRWWSLYFSQTHAENSTIQHKAFCGFLTKNLCKYNVGSVEINSILFLIKVKCKNAKLKVFPRNVSLGHTGWFSNVLRSYFCLVWYSNIFIYF